MMDWFIKRKIFHISVGITVTGLLYYGLIGIQHLTLLLLFGTVISILHKKYDFGWIRIILLELDRKNDLLPGMGSLTFLCGVVLLLAIFGNTAIVHASIMVLTFGDSFASLFGRWISASKMKTTVHPGNSSKVLEGTLFGTAVATLAAMVFVPFLYALAGSVAGMAIEGFEIKKGKYTIDDNILICIASASAIALVAKLGGV